MEKKGGRQKAGLRMISICKLNPKSLLCTVYVSETVVVLSYRWRHLSVSKWDVLWFADFVLERVPVDMFGRDEPILIWFELRRIFSQCSFADQARRENRHLEWFFSTDVCWNDMGQKSTKKRIYSVHEIWKQTRKRWSLIEFLNCVFANN